MKKIPPSATSDLSVLIIDDEGPYRRVLAREMARVHAQVRDASSAEEGLELIAQAPADVILLDLKMAGLSGTEFLAELRARGHDSEVVVITGYPNLDTAVEALRHEAYDYLTKPVDLDDLERTVRRAADRRRLRRQNQALRKALTPAGHTQLVSRSPAMQKLLERLPKLAATHATLLITGATGTGKELIAREVHRLSPRRDEPLVTIDCGALQPSVRGSELFGHEKGAFTGAVESRPGLFEAADGGTVFLDEIGELDPESQASLLRVLENSQVRRLGSTRAQDIDVRIIAATHRDLAREVEAGNFREDLLYRLQVLQLEIPPLRERVEDLPDLLAAFLAQYTTEGRALRFSDEAMKILRRHRWPGNIRELKNLTEMLAITAEGDTIEATDLPPRIVDAGEGSARSEEVTSWKEVERRHILAVYRKAGFQKKRAAELLGLSLRTLYNKLAEYEASDDGPPGEE